jgi:UDP-N-acetylglucosamine 2-epimerase (non-hydrolysing)
VKRIMAVYGTRPEAIKMAPVIGALRDSAHFEPLVAVSAQHRSMLDQVNELFGIVPDYDLNIITERQTLTEITTRTLQGLEPVLEKEAPDAVLVQGDTTTTFAGALAAFYHRIPVVHLEAGLRTDDPYSPYPEELNRRLTTQLATLHLAPTPQARDNLLRDGVRRSSVMVTGNTVIDALLDAVARGGGYGEAALDELDRSPERPVLLVTAHRRESWGRGMESIGEAVAHLARSEPELLIVFPLHRNPVVRAAILPRVEGLPNVLLVEPLPYGAFARLLNRAHVVLTDSGGVQEEGPSLGKPVLVMRDGTERPEAVAAGTARLVGTRAERIVAEVRRLLHDAAAHAAMANAVNPYGDGRAATRSVRALGAWFGLCDPLPEFTPRPLADTPLAPGAAGVEDDLAAQGGAPDPAEDVVVDQQHDDVGLADGGLDVDQLRLAGVGQ